MIWQVELQTTHGRRNQPAQENPPDEPQLLVEAAYESDEPLRVEAIMDSLRWVLALSQCGQT